MKYVCGFLTAEDQSYANKQLLSSGFTLDLREFPIGSSGYQFSHTVDELWGVSTEWANAQVSNNIEQISILLNNDFWDVYPKIRVLFEHYFGVVHAILGMDLKEIEVQKAGKLLSKKVNVEALLKGFQSVEAVDIQTFSEFLIFLHLYDKPKLRKVSEAFDYKRLGELYSEDEKLDHHHRALISILHNPKSKTYLDYVSSVISRPPYVERTFFKFNSALAIERLKDGVVYSGKYTFKEDFKIELIILKAFLDDEGREITERIISENEAGISEAIFTRSMNVDDNREKFEFMEFLHSEFPSFLKKAFGKEASNRQLIEKLPRLLKGKKWEKKLGRVYFFFLNEYAQSIDEEIQGVKKQFPSLSALTSFEKIVEK